MSAQSVSFARAIVADALLAHPDQYDTPTDPAKGISNRVEQTKLPWGYICPEDSYEATQRSRLAREGGRASQDAMRTAGAAQGFSQAHMTGNRFAGGTDSDVKSEKEIKDGRSAYGRGGKDVLLYEKALKDGAPAEKVADLKRKADDAERENKRKKSENAAGGNQGVKLGTDFGGDAKSGHQVTIKLIVDGAEVPLSKTTHTVKAARGRGGTKLAVGEHNALSYTDCTAKVRDAVMRAKGWGKNRAVFKAHFHPNTVEPPCLRNLSGQHGVIVKVVNFW